MFAHSLTQHNISYNNLNVNSNVHVNIGNISARRPGGLQAAAART